jgi:signal transduction protein with GAF and PtsI domain
MIATDPFIATIRTLLATDATSDASLQAALDCALKHFNCVLGTIHLLDAKTQMLILRAQSGLPEALQERVRTIPMGKGMAGLAAERREPVQVCNLQTDSSGVAKPSARETQMAGALAVPMMVGDSLLGTLGIAKPVEYQFTEGEIALLSQVGTVIGEFMNRAVSG